jgi:hypothetical protein
MGIGLGNNAEIENKEHDSTSLSFSLLSLGIGVTFKPEIINDQFNQVQL